ncbi:MAG: tRNA (adenosine(37)-N6)-dimethylallyltransferase MiaA [Geminicoccaceae bacterium]
MRFSSSLLVIGGTTASGKSALALDAVERLAKGGVRAEIVNADSVQLYRHLPILTARPDAAEEARAPHHLYGILEPREATDAARWLSLATATIADIHERGGLPLLVGGTGLYIHSLLQGIAPVPDIDPAIRETVRRIDAAELHALLVQEDPAMAERLEPGDTQRLMRALEVVRSTGRSLARWQEEPQAPPMRFDQVHGAVLLPPREEPGRGSRTA